jgi:hypothetical protein
LRSEDKIVVHDNICQIAVSHAHGKGHAAGERAGAHACDGIQSGADAEQPGSRVVADARARHEREVGGGVGVGCWVRPNRNSDFCRGDSAKHVLIGRPVRARSRRSPGRIAEHFLVETQRLRRDSVRDEERDEEKKTIMKKVHLKNKEKLIFILNLNKN